MEWEDYPESEDGQETQVITREKIKKPSMYKVLMYNDNYTTMEFVVLVLESVFHKPLEEAVNIMLRVHNDGVGICGLYSAEVAETKINAVHELAKTQGFPLKCSMEEE